MQQPCGALAGTALVRRWSRSRLTELSGTVDGCPGKKFIDYSEVGTMRTAISAGYAFPEPEQNARPGNDSRRRRHPHRAQRLANGAGISGRALGGTPDSERRLPRETDRLKRLREDDKKVIQQLKTDDEALIGALHLVQLQNEHLRWRRAESGR